MSSIDLDPRWLCWTRLELFRPTPIRPERVPASFHQPDLCLYFRNLGWLASTLSTRSLINLNQTRSPPPGPSSLLYASTRFDRMESNSTHCHNFSPSLYTFCGISGGQDRLSSTAWSDRRESQTIWRASLPKVSQQKTLYVILSGRKLERVTSNQKKLQVTNRYLLLHEEQSSVEIFPETLPLCALPIQLKENWHSSESILNKV